MAKRKKYYRNTVDRATLGKEFDRRRKLTDEQKQEISKLKGADTIANIAAMFDVSRRTIDFIWHPEKAEENKMRTKENYYKRLQVDGENMRKKAVQSIKNHRDYKRKLLADKLISA